MAQDTFIPLTQLPKRLLFRERQLEEAVALLKARESFAVRGPFGTGKTTLLRIALSKVAVPHVYVECMHCRTYSCIRRRVDHAKLVVLDDYSLAYRSPELSFLVSRIPLKVVVVNKSLDMEELKNLKMIEMPPYTRQEVTEILAQWVAELRLRVSDEQVEACADKGYRAGGNVRVALLCLAGYL
jgi:Cdc6-like AAA superfamily ATPase